MVEIEGVEISWWKFAGVHCQFDVLGGAWVAGHFHQRVASRIHPQAATTSRAGYRGPADAGAIAGFLRIDVAVKKRRDQPFVDCCPRTRLAVGVVFVRPVAIPFPERRPAGNLALVADSRDRRQIFVGAELCLDQNLPVAREAVADRRATLFRGNRQFRRDHDIVSILHRIRRGGGGSGTCVLPDLELVMELGTLVVIRRWTPEIELQRGAQPFLFLGLDRGDAAERFVDQRGDILRLECD